MKNNDEYLKVVHNEKYVKTSLRELQETTPEYTFLLSNNN